MSKNDAGSQNEEKFKKANPFCQHGQKMRVYLKIWQDLKEKHNALSKAQNLRKRPVKWRKEQECFLQEPYKYARNIFDQPKWGVFKTEKISGKTFKTHTLIPIDTFLWNIITTWFGQPSLRWGSTSNHPHTKK